jgi:hypothetical protein
MRRRGTHYTRRDFLRVAAAGLPVVGIPWYFSSAARAGAETEAGYAQARADLIHNRSTEEEIKQSNEDPEEIRARVIRRVRDLKANQAG